MKNEKNFLAPLLQRSSVWQALSVAHTRWETRCSCRSLMQVSMVPSWEERVFIEVLRQYDWHHVNMNVYFQPELHCDVRQDSDKHSSRKKNDILQLSLNELSSQSTNRPLSYLWLFSNEEPHVAVLDLGGNGADSRPGHLAAESSVRTNM